MSSGTNRHRKERKNKPKNRKQTQNTHKKLPSGRGHKSKSEISSPKRPNIKGPQRRASLSQHGWRIDERVQRGTSLQTEILSKAASRLTCKRKETSPDRRAQEGRSCNKWVRELDAEKGKPTRPPVLGPRELVWGTYLKREGNTKGPNQRSVQANRGTPSRGVNSLRQAPGPTSAAKG